MRKLTYLVLLCSFSVMAKEVPHIKSQRLLEVIEDLKEQYAHPVSKVDKIDQKDVDNLSYFIRFIDADGTVEQAKLKAFLLGVQEAKKNNFIYESSMGMSTEFCPFAGSYWYTGITSDNPTLPIENMIWKGLEQEIARDDPKGIDKRTWEVRTGIFQSRGIYSGTWGWAFRGFKAAYPCSTFDKE